MERCEYFNNCGSPGSYECEHEGMMPENSPQDNCRNYIRFDLEKAAEEMKAWDESEDLRRVREDTDIAEMMKQEFTI